MLITLHLFDKILLSFKAFLLILAVMSASSVSTQVWWRISTGWLDAKFGNVSISSIAPVIVTEWSLESDATANGNATLQWCDVNSNAAARTFLIYLQNRGIGLLGFSYDLPNTPMQPRDGRVTLDAQATPSTLLNTSCESANFSPGKIIQIWYRTGNVPPLE